MTEELSPGKHLIERFGSFSHLDHPGEYEACLLINRALDEDFDEDSVDAGIRLLVNTCDKPQAPWTYLRALGFSGDQTGNRFLDNSRLDKVLERKRGIPITLAILLVHVARQFGHSAWGINFPGHFLARVNDQLIDPFNMEVVSEAACLSRLSEKSAGNPFETADGQAVLLRMLNNLKYGFALSRTWERALDMVDYQLAVLPDTPALLIERGDFWARLGAIAAARQSYQQALEIAGSQLPGGAVHASLAQARLNGITGASETLH